MRADVKLNLTGHKDRRWSVRLTGSVGATGFASGGLFLTTDRHSYYRHWEAGGFGFSKCRPKPDWPAPAHTPDLP
jgi:hypothetical protein